MNHELSDHVVLYRMAINILASVIVIPSSYPLKLLFVHRMDLDHSVDQTIDQVLSVTPVTSAGLVETVSLSNKSTLGGAHLEGPQEAIDFLEVWTNSVDLVDDILDSVNTELSEVIGNGGVVRERNSASVDLQETSLVDELSDGSEGWVSESAVWGDSSEHLSHWTVYLEENTVVQLLESEQLQDLLRLGGHLVDTDESGNEEELGLWLDEEVSAFTSLSSHSDEIGFAGVVFLHVLEGSLLQVSSLGGVVLQ